MSEVLSLASLMQSRHGLRQRSIRLLVMFSKVARVSVVLRCFGAPFTMVMKGSEICALVTCESSFLAFSAASFRRCSAILSLRRSRPPFSLAKLSAKWLMTRSSKSSPPRWVSPLVASTSTTPSPTSRMDTSNVPPPRSKMAILPLLPLSMW